MLMPDGHHPRPSSPLDPLVPGFDAETLAYMHSQAEVCGKRVHLTDACVARAQARERTAKTPEAIRLRLRQRIECGRYRRSEPAALPAELSGRWDGFVDCDGLLFCLVARPGEPRGFDAVTCFDIAFAEWRVCVAGDHGRLAGTDLLIVELSDHAVARYVERVRPAGSRAAGRHELGRLLSGHALVLPELPAWAVGDVREDAPYFLVCMDWLVLPLGFKPDSSFVFTVITCLGAGLGKASNRAARRPRRAAREVKLRAEHRVVDVSPHRRIRRKRRGGRPDPGRGRGKWEEADR
jgi:hypothetical protein